MSRSTRQENRLGGHSHTVDAPGLDGGAHTPVDTGFIVYNDTNYPNLVALFDHLKVPTKASDMSFAVSVDAWRQAGIRHFDDGGAVRAVA